MTTGQLINMLMQQGATVSCIVKVVAQSMGVTAKDAAPGVARHIRTLVDGGPVYLRKVAVRYLRG